MTRTVLVFMKRPEPGRVKTRLAADLGAEQAAALYAQWIGIVLSALQPLRPAARVVGYVDGGPPEAFTRWAALAYVAFLIVITPIFHNFWTMQGAERMANNINFMKNVTILGGFLLLYAFGPGKYSVDMMMLGRRPMQREPTRARGEAIPSYANRAKWSPDHR